MSVNRPVIGVLHCNLMTCARSSHDEGADRDGPDDSEDDDEGDGHGDSVHDAEAFAWPSLRLRLAFDFASTSRRRRFALASPSLRLRFAVASPSPSLRRRLLLASPSLRLPCYWVVGGDGCKGASFGGRGGSRYATPLRSAQRALQVSKRERQVQRFAKTHQRHISGTSAARQRLVSGSSAAMFSRGFSLVPLGQPRALIN